MKKSTLTYTGGIVAAIFASLCCIGPLVLALAGVGSLGLFSVFEVYRPYLIGLTVILLAVAFYLTYRKKEVICEDGSCKIESAGKWNKLGIWAAAFIAGSAIVFPYFGGSILSSANASFQHQVFPATSPSKVILDIEGMDCRACAAGIEKSLNNLNGVSKATVFFEEGKAKIEFDSKKLKLEEIKKQVEKTGFKTSVERIGG